MRQPQQNRRNRGRGGRSNNNRSSNPLSRNYESNGPEVKIKGSAAHIAEKYMTLARDALSSGNTVTAENYFQHAEHYYRIIHAAQAKQEEQQANAQHANKGPRASTNTSTNNSNNRRTRPQPVAAEKAEAPEKVVEAEIPGSGEQPSVNGNKAAVSTASEEKPKRKPRARKPKIVKKEESDSKEVSEADNKDNQSNITV